MIIHHFFSSSPHNPPGHSQRKGTRGPTITTPQAFPCYFGSLGTSLNKKQSKYQRGDICQQVFKSIYKTRCERTSKGRPAVHPEPVSLALIPRNPLMAKEGSSIICMLTPGHKSIVVNKTSYGPSQYAEVT